MKYSKQQCIDMIRSFNKKTFPEKLITLRDNKETIKLEYDCGWSWIEFIGMDEYMTDEIQNEEWFEWDNECFRDSSDQWDLMLMAGIV